MAKMKVFEVKNLINNQYQGNIESKDIQSFLEKNMGVKKTHSSNLDDHEVKAVKEHFTPAAKKTSESPATKKVRSASQSETKPATAGMTKPAGLGQRGSQGMRPDGSNQARPQGLGMAKPATQGQRGSQGVKPEGRPEGSSQNRPQGTTQSKPQGMRSDESGMPRPTGQSRPQGMRAEGTDQRGQQGMRQDGTGTARPDGSTEGRTEGSDQNRPQGSGQNRPTSSGQSRPQGMRTDGSGQARQGGYNQDRQGQTGRTYPANQQGARQGSYQDNRRPYDPNRPRTDGQQQGTRTDGSTQTRPGGYNQDRPGGYNQDRQGQTGRTYQGDRGARPANQQGARQGSYQDNRRPYDPNRPRTDGQQQGVRTDGSGQTRPAGTGYSRPGGYNQDRPGGYNQDRQGQTGRTYQGDRGARPANQQGARPGSYQDNRKPYDPNRPRTDGQQQGTRTDGSGQARPYNNNYNNNRTGGYAGSGTGTGTGSGQRPYNNTQGNYQRPQGGQGNAQRGGYNPRGYETFNKDEDDKPAYGNRSTANKRGPQSQRGNERKTFDQQILNQKVAEKSDNRRNRDRMNKDKQHKDKTVLQKDNDGGNKIIPKKGQFIKPKPIVVEKEDIKVITLPEVLTIKELSDKMKIPGASLVKKLFLAGQVVTINQEITYEEAEEIALSYDIISEKEVLVNEVEELLKEEDEDPTAMVKRPPVVCVMGHVDHGKTSLLDAIRHANVTSREAGGITQHIGAYIAEIKGEKITFLDTPGHEAFTSMRMRGAQATDIAILVVAADDGVMPQTVEAISHAKAAGVKIIVAINKIDKPSANVERVKQELTEYELIAEDWGGSTIFVPVSAHTNEGIEQLLEMILLTAEIEELKANPDRMARGLVIEAELDKGRGPVATILVQKGTLRVGDNIAVGSSFGKVRAMINDKGNRTEVATPSTAVEILGLNTVPDVGEIFMATDNEKEARTISEAFITQGKEKLLSDTKAKLSLDGLFSQIQAGNIKELNLIIKADVQGSVEAMKQSLLKLSNDEVAVRIIHGGVGAINESDVILASTSNGIIIGFNVKPDNRAKEIADYENVDVKLYRVIYNAINDVEAAMKGLLDPVYEEKITGHAEVRQIFKASSLGTIAGSYVLDGKITRGNKLRIYRGKDLIHEGNLASLKRFQDDVKEVAAGYECGLVFDKFHDVLEGDKVEFYVMVEVPR